MSDSCAEGGDYCKFNKRFLDLLKKLESEKWFEEFSMINGEPDWIYNEKKGRYQKVKLPAPFLKVEWIGRDVIWGLIKGSLQSQCHSVNYVQSVSPLKHLNH